MSPRVIRGSRLTSLSNSVNDVDRGAGLAGRRTAEFWCAADHLTTVVFSDDAEVEAPLEWPCGHCGAPATTERGTAVRPSRRIEGPHKTPYEFMMMRRTEADGERLLAEALGKLRRAGSTRSRG